MAIAANPIKNVGNKKFIRCKNNIIFTRIRTYILLIMKKIILATIVIFLTANALKSQNIICNIGSAEIEQIEYSERIQTWHHLLGLDDGSSVFLYSDAKRTTFFMKYFDKNTALILDKKVLEFKSEKGARIEISEVFETNKNLTFFISFASKNNIKFLKIILDKHTGEKISEEEISSHSILDNNYLDSKNYFVDLTKNDSLQLYYFTTFVKTNEATSELKMFCFNYENKLISKVSKTISKKYDIVNRITSIQESDNYYLVINYLEKIKKAAQSSNKQQIIIYKAKNETLEELSLKIERLERPFSFVSAQFTLNHSNQVRLAVSNFYTSIVEAVNVDNPCISDITIFGISSNKLEIESQYDVSQNKLHNSYNEITNIPNNKRIYVYNCLVNFYTNFNNQDELVFQSYSDKRNGNGLDTRIQDIGVFDFDKQGNVIKSSHYPLYWRGNILNPLMYNRKHSDQMHEYISYFPEPELNKKHMLFIPQTKNTFILYNDFIDNSKSLKRDEVTPVYNHKNATGSLININNSTSFKSTILNSNEVCFFNFYTSHYNKKSGILSTIVFKNKKYYVAHLKLN